MILDFEQHDVYPLWAAKQLDIDREYFGNCSTIAVWNGAKICAVVVYSSFNGVNCEVTVAANSKWWVRKSVMDILFKYPFEQLGCKRITLLVRETNQPVIRLAEKLGFSREGMLREFYPDGDACIVLGALRSERKH